MLLAKSNSLFLKIGKADLVRGFLEYLAKTIDLADSAREALSETTLRVIFVISSLSFGVRTREL